MGKGKTIEPQNIAGMSIKDMVTFIRVKAPLNKKCGVTITFTEIFEDKKTNTEHEIYVSKLIIGNETFNIAEGRIKYDSIPVSGLITSILSKLTREDEKVTLAKSRTVTTKQSQITILKLEYTREIIKDVSINRRIS